MNPQSGVPQSLTRNQFKSYSVGEQVPLDLGHDVEEVVGGDVALAVRVLQPEGHVGVLLVEVVQELRELGVGHAPVLLPAEVELDEVGVEGEGSLGVECRLLDDLGELLCKNRKQIISESNLSQ